MTPARTAASLLAAALCLPGCWPRQPGPAPLVEARGPVVMMEAPAEHARVDLVVALRAGSAFDPPGKEGLAWLTAHAVAEGGAGGRGAESTADALYRLGTRVKVVVGPELVALHLPCVAEQAADCAALLADMVGAPDLDAAAVDRVRARGLARLEERALGGAAPLAALALTRTLYAGHPYGHAPDGRLGSLPILDEGDVRHFMADHWLRPAAVVGVAGAVSPEARAVLQDGVSRLPARLPDLATAHRLPASPGRAVVRVETATGSDTHVVVGHALDVGPDHPDRLALEVGLAVLGGPVGGRLLALPALAPAAPRLSLDGASVRSLRLQPALRLDLHPTAQTAAPVPLALLALDALDAMLAEGVTDAEVAAEVARRVAVLDAWSAAAPGRVHAQAVERLLDVPDLDAQRAIFASLDGATVSAALETHLRPRDARVVVAGPPRGASPATVEEDADGDPPVDASTEVAASLPPSGEDPDASSVQEIATLSAQELLR